MKSFREYMNEKNDLETSDEKIKQQIFKYFKNDVVSSILIDKKQIDINFKNKNFILGIKDLKLLGFNQNQSKDMKGRLSGKKAQVQRIARKIVPNKNVGKLIGWWLAEGSVDCGRISISLHKDELHFAKELMEIIK